MRAELAALAAAAQQAGEVVPVFDFAQPVLNQVFAGFSFNAKAVA